MAHQGLTEQQEKWFASVRANLERNTGKPLAQWLEIARTAPAGSLRDKVKWFKAEHGLLQNSAIHVLSELEGGGKDWDGDGGAQRDALWTDPAARAVFEALERRVDALEDVVAGQRKGYSAWSRKAQFAAARPVRSAVRLGLALTPAADARLLTPRNESWSERLKATLMLAAPEEVDDEVAALIRQAWERS